MGINLINVTVELEDINIIIHMLKMFFLSICTYITFSKTINEDKIKNSKNFIIFLFAICCTSFIISTIKYIIGTFFSIICMILLLSFVFILISKNNIGYTILITTISLSFNYIIFVTAIIIAFIPKIIFRIENDF